MFRGRGGGGPRLSQIRFRRGNALLDAEALRALHARERLVDDDDADVSEGIAVSVDLSGLGPDGLVGYRAKRHTGLIDVERRAGYDVADFWESMRWRKDQSLILDPTRSMASASDRTTRRRGSSYRSISEPERVWKSSMPSAIRFRAGKCRFQKNGGRDATISILV